MSNQIVTIEQDVYAKGLTQVRLRELLRYDPKTGMFTWVISRPGGVMANQLAGQINQNGRAYIGVLGKRYLASRLAWFYVNGSWPKHDIDHVNGNVSDNRIANLRDVSHLTNSQNRRLPNTRRTGRSSNFLGVSWKRDREKWVANISTNRKTKHLGYFDNEEAAHQAYLSAKRQLHPGNTL